VSRPTATPALHRSAVILAGTIVVMLGSGCAKDTAVITTTTPSACTPPGGSIATASRSDVATWASTLPFVAADPSRAYVYGFAASDSVVIEAVDTVHLRTLAPKGCVIARLTSAVARPASGIGAGANYIWVDSLTGGYKTVLIPADTTVSMTMHALAVHNHTLGDPAIAPVGALGFCGYCDKDARKWCRAGLDSASTTSISAFTEAAVK